MASSSGRRSFIGSSSERGRFPLFGGRKDDRKIQLLVIGSEIDEQVEDLVDHRLGALLDSIHLVDDDERAQAACERLADHEARLGHHALDGVHQQQDAIHHSEHPFHLAAEVGVTRRVDQVDPNPLEGDASLLGVDRDAALALEILAVHHAFSDFLVLAKRAGLRKRPSSKVVLPWSTCAMIARFRRSLRGCSLIGRAT